jgi:protein gp37
MADNTHIEWTDATWNPITGCSVVSPGCSNCYAMRLAGSRLQHHPSRKGLTKPSKAGPVWTGKVRLNKEWLDQPLRWKRSRNIFVCAHGDLFAENVPDEWIDQVFAVMALCPQHRFQVLTKRAKRMREYMTERWQPALAREIKFPDGSTIGVPAEKRGETRQTQVHNACEVLIDRFVLADTENDKLWTVDGALKIMQWKWPLPNVWLGVSVEDQTRANERIPDLLATPAAVRWISAEPLLGPLDLTRLCGSGGAYFDAMIGESWYAGEDISTETVRGGSSLNWIVVGGESGPGARVWPGFEDACRSLRGQCTVAGVAFFMKQMAGAVKARMPAIPDDLMIREMPHAD